MRTTLLIHRGVLKTVIAVALAAAVSGLAGCASGPYVIPPDKRLVIDRAVIEYPGGYDLQLFAAGLTAPSAIAFDTDEGPYKGSMIIAESGVENGKPRIYGFKPSGEQFNIYPYNTSIFSFFDKSIQLYGPIGGIAVSHGKVYVTHRDDRGMGAITAFDYNGKSGTVIADLPAQGDYSVTDVAMHPSNGRLYFGLGATTNSGVVGLDNWEVGWVQQHPNVADHSLNKIKLNGYRFTTPNPAGGLFGGDDIAVTAPYQAFGASRQLRIPASPSGKPTAAVYSVNPDGGDLRVEAHGIRLPRGLAFNEFGNLFVTNQGMELRGTRPVKDDPDVILRVPLGGQIWFGWPDFTADLQPISEVRYQPLPQMIIKTGYPELADVVDHDASGLLPPDRGTLLRAVFPSLSGTAKLTFVPENNDAFRAYRNKIIVALSGDRAPFSNSGQKLSGPIGYKVLQVDLDTKQIDDFVFNTRRVPASQLDKPYDAMERPFDVKFGPDGALYILDYGIMEMKNGNERITNKTGRIYRLIPIPVAPTTKKSGL